MKSGFFITFVLSANSFWSDDVVAAQTFLRHNNRKSLFFRLVMNSTSLQPTITTSPSLEPSQSAFNDILPISKQPYLTTKIMLSMNFPSSQPTYQPRNKPSLQPINAPSNQPTYQPRNRPSLQPIMDPSNQPTYQPNGRPSLQPMNSPTRHPTNPTSHPTKQPTQQHQPTSSPNKPSRQPSGQPSQQPKHVPTSLPTSSPTSSPSNRPIARAWFYTTFMDFKSLPYLVMFSITGFLFLLAFLTFVFAGMVDISDGRSIGFLLSVVNFILWTTFHFVMLAARFDFWLNKGQQFQPYRIDSNGVMIWVHSYRHHFW